VCGRSGVRGRNASGARRARLCAAAGLAIGLSVGAAGAQERAIDPLDLTGASFQGIRLPLAVSNGWFGAAGRRMWAWREGGTQRLLIEGDVRIRLGLQEFAAKRAAVWFETVEASGGGGESGGERQVYVYFDDVRTPTADAAVAVSANRLAVRGVVSAEDEVEVRADLMEKGRPRDMFLLEAERDFANALRRVASGLPLDEPEEAAGGIQVPIAEAARPALRGSESLPEDAESALRGLSAGDERAPIFADTGVLSVNAGDATIVGGEGENAVLVTDGVALQYWDRASRRTLQLSAERGVVFLSKGAAMDSMTFAARDVRGIYLEGGVTASDGQYTLRAPRIYYDVERNAAAAVDAVFWTYDRRLAMPLYLRAEVVRQESATQFSAGRATMANSAFFTPHFSIGTTSVTLTRLEDEDRTVVDAKNITLVAGGLIPFLYVPRLKGDPRDVPLRELGYEDSAGSGQALTTAWDTLSILGIDAGPGLDAETLLDWYFDRGVAFGQRLSWVGDRRRGEAFGYILPDDDGKDTTRTGAEIQPDSRTRGILLGEQKWNIDDQWSVFAELAYVSDATFVDAFFPELGESGRELATSVMLRRTTQQSLFVGQARANLNDFSANEYLLSSQGFTVERLPELRYIRPGDDIFDEGRLTYHGETSLSNLRMKFFEPEAQDIGFIRARQSQEFFGIDPDQSQEDALRAQGYISDDVVRLDTRHELGAPMEFGALDVTPFVVGRLTAWDNSFEAYSPQEDDKVRLWGGGGVRFGTEIYRVDNGMESRVLDLHRVRHIIRPHATLWAADTTIQRDDLPVYDESVEGISDGTAVHLALDQTWQTQRGGPGRWRSVDVLQLNVAYTNFGRDTDEESPIGRWIDGRPELSNPGEFVDAEAIWEASDAVAFSGRTVYDLRLNQQAISSVGVLLDQQADLSAYAALSYINSQDDSSLDAGVRYRLSPKYYVGAGVGYNFDEDQIQNLRLSVERELPNFTFRATASFDNIQEETSFGFSIRPNGVRSGGLAARGIGASDARQRGSGLGG
jgi:hypothetical protein